MQRDNIIGTLHTDERVNGGLSPRERLTGYGSVGGGVSSYNELTDLPTMNGRTIEGDMTPADLDIWQPKNFSTTEQNTGLKWIDGKDIYRNVITYTISGSGSMNVISDTNIDSITSISIVMRGGNNQMFIPYFDGSDWILCQRYNGYIRLVTNSSWFSNNVPNVTITLEYTKL